MVKDMGVGTGAHSQTLKNDVSASSATQFLFLKRYICKEFHGLIVKDVPGTRAL